MNRSANLLTVVALILLPSCAPAPEPLPTPSASQTKTPDPATPSHVPSTDIPEPTATPLHPQNLTFAADKLNSGLSRDPVKYTVDGMDDVMLANVPYKAERTADIYYPPGFDFTVPLPAVIFVNGVGDSRAMEVIGIPFKDFGPFISWGQLVAASGLVAVTYEAGRSPLSDTKALIDFLTDNRAWLGVSAERLCLWSSSSHSPVALDLLTDLSFEHRDSLACGVIYYGDTPTERPLRQDVPLLIVIAGQEDPANLAMNANTKDLVAESTLAGVPIEFIEYAEGVHGFDAAQDTEETRDIVRRTLEFLQTSLVAR